MHRFEVLDCHSQDWIELVQDCMTSLFQSIWNGLVTILDKMDSLLKKVLPVTIPTWVFYGGSVTFFAGFIFGFDTVIIGSVSSGDDFLRTYFPDIYTRRNNEKGDELFCTPTNWKFQAYNYLQYATGGFSCFVAAYVTKKWGHRRSLQVAGGAFIVGSLVGAFAINLTMLYLGRAIFGIGIGFGNQAAPLYITDISPLHLRGTFNITFELSIAIGILMANIVNYYTNKLHGHIAWRLSYGIQAIMPLFMGLLAIKIRQTPSWLGLSGNLESARIALSSIRRAAADDADAVAKNDDKINAELSTFTLSNPANATNSNSQISALRDRGNIPQLIIAVVLQLCQQLTGFTAITIICTHLFKELDLSSKASLHAALCIGGVRIIFTFVSCMIVDWVGRRKLLLSTGIGMSIMQLIMATVLTIKTNHGEKNLSQAQAKGAIIVMLIFIATYAISWGPIGWLLPSETFPLSCRYVGQSVTVLASFLSIFMVDHLYLTLSCDMKFCTLFFFACFIPSMTWFVFSLILETNNIRTDKMIEELWMGHHIWKHFYAESLKVNSATT